MNVDEHTETRQYIYKAPDSNPTMNLETARHDHLISATPNHPLLKCTKDNPPPDFTPIYLPFKKDERKKELVHPL
jgi:hypothetical protein